VVATIPRVMAITVKVVATVIIHIAIVIIMDIKQTTMVE